MICYRDITYCASPNCTNECGRQLTQQIELDAKRFGLPISCAYFCGDTHTTEKGE